MFRSVVLYIWLALIAIAFAYVFIDVNVNGVEVPQLPQPVITGFFIVAGILTVLVFFSAFHRSPEGEKRMQEEIDRYERRKKAADKSRWH